MQQFWAPSESTTIGTCEDCQRAKCVCDDKFDLKSFSFLQERLYDYATPNRIVWHHYVAWEYAITIELNQRWWYVMKKRQIPQEKYDLT